MNPLNDTPDSDSTETREWLESLQAVTEREGTDRAHYLLERMVSQTRRAGGFLPFAPTTDYVNTIPPEAEVKSPGDAAMEWRVRSLIRWNAMAMVVRTNRKPGDLGGHIASFASVATLFDVGFNHFWRGPTADHPGDLVSLQGHSSPGVYARSFLEGRLSESQLDNFRMEVDGKGIPSYPHPWLMPDYWQMPTVSMGLGPLAAIYQARNSRYLEHRGLLPTTDRKIWCFLGDGECDEPESLGAISVAGRENLDNLVFVINCNLQRLDGPVRGNGKIIQELESFFRGAGWNVIKVVWGREWDALLHADRDGALVNLMNITPDGDYQTYRANDGGFIREHFFGRDPRTKELVQRLSDQDIWNLKRGGHDYRKVYAAYRAAMEHKGQPTIILAKTIKGYTLGTHFEGRNATHQMKKLALQDLKDFRDVTRVPISDAQLEEDPYLPPYYHPGAETPEIRYLLERRRALGGFVPARRNKSTPLALPGSDTYKVLKKGSGSQLVATTMATVRTFKELLRDKNIGPRLVPIIPDEARTFGMDSWFPSLKIYNRNGQLYTSVDSELMLAYKESEVGQILHEGINEAGSTASFTAVGTSYSTHNEPMIPIYIFYSMFGFQRTGDGLWAAADQMARGFVLGATAGRTTLTGEGLQHADGHSLLLASTNPAAVTYDPAFAYEVAYIIESGLSRMYGEHPESVYFYITIYNEPYVQPAQPEGLDVEGLLRGMYRYRRASEQRSRTAQILASGVSMPEALRAADLLAADWDVAADVWSVTSWGELNREGVEIEQHRLRHPDEPARTPHVTKVLADAAGPVVAVSDWMRAVPEQIRPWVPGTYITLGTDGFGFSDTRPAARRFFNTDAESVAVAVLQGLARDGEIDPSVAVAAAKQYRIDDVAAAEVSFVDPGSA